MATEIKSLFRLSAPTKADIDSFHNDGYIAYPNILSDDARENLISEITGYEPVQHYLNAAAPNFVEPNSFFVRPWNERRMYSGRLIDDPFIMSLLRSTIGEDYQFCHSALNIAPRGAGAIPYHQDHHHWRHENPINLAERDTYYVQILYYPNGFTLGDRNLKVIPGSHRVAPTETATPERMLAGEFDAEAGRQLDENRLSLPPGSMVYINARIFHAVEAKPLESPQPYRIFNIDIFKEAGPPHRYTQEIPPEWMVRANATRRKLFTREAYTEGCWAS